MLICSYLLGSVHFSIWFAKIFGIKDPRTYGSKNPGATNIARSGSKSAAILTLLFDLGKTICAYQLASYAHYNPALCAFAAFLTLLGHIYPLNKKGGRGVACLLGLLLILNPYDAAIFLIIWLTGYYKHQNAGIASSMGSSAIAFKELFGLYTQPPTTQLEAMIIPLIIVSTLIVINKHKGHILAYFEAISEKV